MVIILVIIILIFCSCFSGNENSSKPVFSSKEEEFVVLSEMYRMVTKEDEKSN